MPSPEFDASGDHEQLALELWQLRLARVALFDELIDYHHAGQCTFEEAIAQYLHDAAELTPDPQP